MHRLHPVPAIALLLAATPAGAEILTRDTTWQGQVEVREDVVVPPGVTLTVRAGTTVRVLPAVSTQTDPEQLSSLTEITVRGTLRLSGTTRRPIQFDGAPPPETPVGWAGLLVDGGTVRGAHVSVRRAESGILALGGTVDLRNAVLRDNRYGLVSVGADTEATIHDGTIRSNDYGLLELRGARVRTSSTPVTGNHKRDRFRQPGTFARPSAHPTAIAETRSLTRVVGHAVLNGDVVWSGRVRVEGVVRVAAGARLILLPGTTVEFTRRDSNGDRLGENGLLLQGILIAKGRPGEPIRLRSAESKPRVGDWDGISIMGSNGALNLIEHCVIEDAYRGLHFHFSNVAVRASTLANNYRGMQFQESRVSVRDSELSANRRGLQARDSNVELLNNHIVGNVTGATLFRVSLQAERNVVRDNLLDGFQIREGMLRLSENLFDGNRNGVSVADAHHGELVGNVATSNGENGMALRNADHLSIRDNYVSANGLTGIGIKDTRATLTGNQIAGNGSRGVGVQALHGSLRANNLVGNGDCAVDLDGSDDVEVDASWWGGQSPRAATCDPGASAARVVARATASAPIPYAWRLSEISTRVVWQGRIRVESSVTVQPQGVLEIRPGTRVELGPGAGLLVHGRIEAVGSPQRPIRFTSMEASLPKSWDEVRLEHANGSVFRDCVFEYATWGLHVHFTALEVERVLFRKNDGGMRFRSGPVTVRAATFTGNRIGMRAFRGQAEVRSSRFVGNDIGVFVREKGSGLSFRGNDFDGNLRYDIRLGDFNDEDVDARENWWSGDTTQTVFDARSEPGIGRVLLEPRLRSPAVGRDD